MRVALGLSVGLVLLIGSTATTAEDSSGRGDDATRQLNLPGFEVSLEVPADWSVEPLIGTPYIERPHATSPFTLRLWTGAFGRENPAVCYLYAYSRLGCTEPVDLATEVRGIGPPWEAFPAAPAAYVAEESMGDWACVRHFSSDGADLFEVKCCGETVPEDGWSSIATTLQLPEQTRPVRVGAANRNLTKDVKATTDVWRDVLFGSLVFEGGGSGGPAHKRMWDPRVEAVVERLARPARSISIFEHAYRGDDGEEVLVLDSIRARKADLDTKADPDDVYDAMLAFGKTEWQETHDGEATFETVPVGRYQATRVVFDDGAAPEYIVAARNGAIKLRAASDEIAQSWLSGLACHHLDVYELSLDVLVENRPDR